MNQKIQVFEPTFSPLLPGKPWTNSITFLNYQLHHHHRRANIYEAITVCRHNVKHPTEGIGFNIPQTPLPRREDGVPESQPLRPRDHTDVHLWYRTDLL